MISLPQYGIFVRFMKKHGMREYLYKKDLPEPYNGLLLQYLESVIMLAREFLYDVDNSYISDEHIYQKLNECEFYRLIELAGTSVSPEVMYELGVVTRSYATYMATILAGAGVGENSLDVLDADMVIHEINESDIVIEVETESSGIQDGFE